MILLPPVLLGDGLCVLIKDRGRRRPLGLQCSFVPGSTSGQQRDIHVAIVTMTKAVVMLVVVVMMMIMVMMMMMMMMMR